MNTAIVIGATGLTGSNLLEFLLRDERFSKVKIFTRRQSGISNVKLEEHIIDFDNPDSFKELLQGNVLFSALGTTIRKAGSKESQYKIDYSYQFKIAEICAKNGVETYVLVSSAGANLDSKIFYSRMKGELDRAVMQLGFNKIRILRPGILEGVRKESRFGEKAFIIFAKVISKIPGLKKLRPIQGRQVAQAMINSYFDETPGTKIFTMEKVFTMSNEYRTEQEE